MQLPGLARGPARGPARRAMGSGREGAARASGHPPTPLIGSGREGAARASGQSASRASVLIWSGLQHAIATVCEQSISAQAEPRGPGGQGRGMHLSREVCVCAGLARKAHTGMRLSREKYVCVRAWRAGPRYALKGGVCVCVRAWRARHAPFKGRCVCVRVVGSISCSCRRR